MTQRSIFDVLTGETRPIHEWLHGLRRLVPEVYPYDADLSRAFEKSLDTLWWWAMDYESGCTRPNDPAAPEAGAPAAALLAWYFGRYPKRHAELRRQIIRIDQLLGRRALLDAFR
jgi:hypothetical protein